MLNNNESIALMGLFNGAFFSYIFKVVELHLYKSPYVFVDFKRNNIRRCYPKKDHNLVKL